MKRWQLTIVLLVLAAGLFVIALRKPAQTDLEQLLAHFDLPGSAYSNRTWEERLPPKYTDTNLSFLQVQDRWFTTVHLPGDRIPIWFERSGGGLFVVVERPDGTLVGTHWDVIGGSWRPATCRTAKGYFCGFYLKRTGGTWIMRKPITRPPLQP